MDALQMIAELASNRGVDFSILSDPCDMAYHLISVGPHSYKTISLTPQDCIQAYAYIFGAIRKEEGW